MQWNSNIRIRQVVDVLCQGKEDKKYFWCEILNGNLVLKEHEDARWLTKEQMEDVDWLPADITLIGKIRSAM